MGILVATDLSTRSATALRFAEVLGAQLDLRLTVLHVAPDTRADIVHDAEHALSLFLREYLEHPELAETIVAVGETVPLLTLAATEHELLVCGATGSSYLDDIFLGSTAGRLIRESPSPVCVVPDHFAPKFDAIVVPVGFDRTGRSCLELAGKISRATAASICVFHALTEAEERDQALSKMELLVDESGLSDCNVSFEVSEHEPAAGVRDAVARLGFDLVVMGTQASDDQAVYFLGSVAERVVRMPPCAVITTRG